MHLLNQQTWLLYCPRWSELLIFNLLIHFSNDETQAAQWPKGTFQKWARLIGSVSIADVEPKCESPESKGKFCGPESWSSSTWSLKNVLNVGTERSERRRRARQAWTAGLKNLHVPPTLELIHSSFYFFYSWIHGSVCLKVNGKGR